MFIEMEKHFFALQLTARWNRLAREAVEFLEAFKSHLDAVLGTCSGWPCQRWGWDRRTQSSLPSTSDSGDGKETPSEALQSLRPPRGTLEGHRACGAPFTGCGSSPSPARVTGTCHSPGQWAPKPFRGRSHHAEGELLLLLPGSPGQRGRALCALLLLFISFLVTKRMVLGLFLSVQAKTAATTPPVTARLSRAAGQGSVRLFIIIY